MVAAQGDPELEYFKMTATSSVSVKGDHLELDGPLINQGTTVLRNVLRNNPNIDQIRLFNIHFSSLTEDFIGDLAEILEKRQWDRIILAYCSGNLSKTIAEGILQARRIEIYGETLNAFQALGDVLGKKNSPIESLKLRTRFLNNTILPLAEALKSNEGLKELFFTCEFDNASLLNLAAGIKENKHLQVLSLYSCEMEDEPSMECLISSLECHPTLSTLELRNNNRFGMNALAVLVRKTKQIKHLAVYHPPHTINHLQVPRLNAESFSIALQENTSLKSLVLCSNGLHAGSALWLALALQKNVTLESLDLQGNLISDRGILALAEVIPDAKGLKKLYLWNNPFSGVGARAILAGLKQNFILEDVTTFSRFRCSDEIQYYAFLNKAGRKILKDDTNNVPMSLWPLVLERVNNQAWDTTEKASVIYTLFREGVGILM